MLAATILAQTLTRWPPCSLSLVDGPRDDHLPSPKETELLRALSTMGDMAGLQDTLMPWERPGVRCELVFGTLQYLSWPHLSLSRPHRFQSGQFLAHPGPEGPSPFQ